jgi:transcription elongation factor Elf1
MNYIDKIPESEDQPMRTVRRFYKCPSCGDSHVEWTGVMLASNPPWYPHKCLQCGYQFNMRVKSGQLVYLYDDANASDQGAALRRSDESTC